MGVYRVLQVFTAMNRGGAESMIMNYYRKIDRSKVQFDFLVHRKKRGAFDDEIEKMGGKIYRFDPINPLLPNKYYKELRAFFSEHNEYTVIHSHLNTFSCFPLKIAKEYNVPCRIAHAHIAFEKIKFQDLFGDEGFKEVVKKMIKLRLKRRIHDSITHSFSCGDKAGKWLFGADNNFTIMNNAIEAQAFAYNETTRKKYRKEFNVEDEFVLGHIGNFTMQKNHSYLLKVFASILKKKPDCSLFFAGDGPLRSKIEKEAAELSITNKIHFLGVRNDIRELSQMFDVFVFPSFYEGLPVTLIEAQSAGLKVVASDRITKEVLLTDDVEFVSIDIDPEVWADKVLRHESYNRVNNYDTIKNKGYDIVSNALKFQEFYLQHQKA